VKAATPKPTWAKAGAARKLRLGEPTLSDCKADAALASNQNIENNPMQSSMVVAGMDSLPAKTF
jgi:hypothetical protein